MKKAVLILSDGTCMYGHSHGADTTQIGELCFNTGMTGYQELFTDPSYYGQLLVMTSNHIGNYGIINSESESERPKIFGMICKEFSTLASRNTAEQKLNSFLSDNGIPVISGIDTRMLVKHIRTHGSMNAMISTEIDRINILKTELARAPSMAGLELASRVTTSTPYSFGEESAKYRVAVYDFGVKLNILNCLAAHDCLLRVFPANTDYRVLLEWKPDGVFLSNGPGDPASMQYAIDNVKSLLDIDIPIFGICMGHQILALAAGARTYKLFNGHRGLNHPVLNLKTNLGEITSQNHGFGVDEQSVTALEHIEVTHRNLNDHTIEGIRIRGKKAFSVQYHPESSPGPHDSRYLFVDFVNAMRPLQN